MKRKRSLAVPAGFTILVAAGITGCSSQQRCIDLRGQTISNIYCGPNPPPLPPPYIAPARWADGRSTTYYGGPGYYGGGGYYGGYRSGPGVIPGGGGLPPNGTPGAIQGSGGVSRGGFGGRSGGMS